MPYNFAADSLHKKKVCSRLSSSEVRFYTENGRFAFLRPPSGGGGLGATYDDPLRLIEKRVVDLLISVNWTFGDFAPTEAGWPKISGRRGRPPPTNHSSSQKSNLNDLSYGIKIWTDLSSVLSQCTRLTDRQTDGQTDTFLIASPRWHSMHRGKGVWDATALSRYIFHRTYFLSLIPSSSKLRR